MGIQGLEGWYFWSNKTDLFSFCKFQVSLVMMMMMIQVDLEEAWISGL